MKTYRIYQVDSFAKERFYGNPAGVVPNADGLTEAQMQKIARELNNSESAFLFQSNSPDYDVEIRFFTPKTEVPLCGHATIASHYVRAMEGTFTSGRVVQKTKAGLLPIDISPDGDGYAIVMTQGTPEIGQPFEMALVDRIAKALGVLPGDLREDCPVCIASTGHGKIMVALKSLEQLHALAPDLTALAAISREVGCSGYYVFTLHPGEQYLAHGRVFSPAIGIVEDPVTGNANGPLGAYLIHYGVCQALEQEESFDFDILQGEAIGRTGTMHVHVEKKDGKPVLVQITGRAVIAFSTEIQL